MLGGVCVRPSVSPYPSSSSHIPQEGGNGPWGALGSGAAAGGGAALLALILSNMHFTVCVLILILPCCIYPKCYMFVFM